MEERLKELTAERVKGLIEAVMRAHLGWLVVWGNIFGGAIGVASEAAVKFIKVQSHCKPVQSLMDSFQMKGQPPRL